jgi:hypothetical protein
MAKKIMFEQQKEEPAGAGGRKNNRRETWCPGRSNWAPMPAGTAAATPALLTCSMTNCVVGPSNGPLFCCLVQLPLPAFIVAWNIVCTRLLYLLL